MIKKFLSNALLSIVMDKSAKEKFHAVRDSRKALKEKAIAVEDTKPEQPLTSAQPAILDRQELIRNALSVHKEQSKVLDTLSDIEKQRLKLLAMHTMMGKGEK